MRVGHRIVASAQLMIAAENFGCRRALFEINESQGQSSERDQLCEPAGIRSGRIQDEDLEGVEYVPVLSTDSGIALQSGRSGLADLRSSATAVAYPKDLVAQSGGGAFAMLENWKGLADMRRIWITTGLGHQSGTVVRLA